MMRELYLEVTFRRGKVLAAYLYLPREEADRVAWSVKARPGLVVDYSPDGRPIGIEITSPSKASMEAINGLLEELGLRRLEACELGSLLAG